MSKKQIDAEFIGKEIAEQKKLGASAIKLSDRKRASLRVEYLKELLKKASQGDAK